MVMSKQAYSALTPQQIATIEQYNRIITPDIGSIENIGGGSVRCMTLHDGRIVLLMVNVLCY